MNLLILGTEHGEYAGPAHDAQWRQIIATVRGAFHGEVTYDELGYIGRPGVAADDVTFWDALDYIGISMYLPLATDKTPSLSEAFAALYNNPIVDWQTEPRINVPATLQALAEHTGKDIIFTEAGSQSRTGALTSPAYTTGGLNFWEQSALYAVLLHEFAKYPWFRGFNWWTNDHDFKSPPGTKDWRDFWSDLHIKEYSFLEKPAGDVLRGFWGDGANGAPLKGQLLLGDEGANNLSGGSLGDLIVAAGGTDNISGLGGGDRLFAGDGPDNVSGGLGADLIFGGSSFRDVGDVLLGGPGSDRIFGGAGNDVLQGNEDDDFLNGGSGKDKLFGNQGKDTFEFAKGDGRDTVRDLEKDLDQLFVDKTLAKNFKALHNAAHDYSYGVVLDFGKDQLKIEGVSAHQLKLVHISFVSDLHL